MAVLNKLDLDDAGDGASGKVQTSGSASCFELRWGEPNPGCFEPRPGTASSAASCTSPPQNKQTSGKWAWNPGQCAEATTAKGRDQTTLERTRSRPWCSDMCVYLTGIYQLWQQHTIWQVSRLKRPPSSAKPISSTPLRSPSSTLINLWSFSSLGFRDPWDASFSSRSTKSWVQSGLCPHAYAIAWSCTSCPHFIFGMHTWTGKLNQQNAATWSNKQTFVSFVSQILRSTSRRYLPHLAAGLGTTSTIVGTQTGSLLALAGSVVASHPGQEPRMAAPRPIGPWRHPPWEVWIIKAFKGTGISRHELDGDLAIHADFTSFKQDSSINIWQNYGKSACTP